MMVGSIRVPARPAQEKLADENTIPFPANGIIDTGNGIRQLIDNDRNRESNPGTRRRYEALRPPYSSDFIII